MPFSSLNMMNFTQAAPSTAPLLPAPPPPHPPPLPHLSPRPWAQEQEWLRAFQEWEVYLTASRHPPPRFPASGLRPREGETARKEDKGNAISTSPVGLDGLLKEEEKRTNLTQCGRDNGSWDLQLRPRAVWVETGPLRIQPQLYPLT